MKQRCKVCHCTDEAACDPPCSWAAEDLCSGCAAVLESMREWWYGAHQPDTNALAAAFTDMVENAPIPYELTELGRRAIARRSA